MICCLPGYTSDTGSLMSNYLGWDRQYREKERGTGAGLEDGSRRDRRTGKGVGRDGPAGAAGMEAGAGGRNYFWRLGVCHITRVSTGGGGAGGRCYVQSVLDRSISATFGTADSSPRCD